MKALTIPQPRPWFLSLISASLGILFAGLVTLQADDKLSIIAVPVRVHLLHSESDQCLQTKLKESDLKYILGKVNNIWSTAGIRFELESICDTHAIEPKVSVRSQGFWVEERLPKSGLLEHGINVIFVSEIVSNGVWTGGIVVVKETAKLREVANGVDEPLPRVTSHAKSL